VRFLGCAYIICHKNICTAQKSEKQGQAKMGSVLHIVFVSATMCAFSGFGVHRIDTIVGNSLK